MKLNNQNLNHETLESIADGCVAKLETSNRPDAKRWQNAIKKAVAELQTNCYWNFDGKELVMMSATSNAVYVPNGKCQCRAYEQNQPCRHRASQRLLTLYIETV